MTALFYRIRRVKGGPLMGLKVWYGPPLDPIDGSELDRSPRWNCYLNGESVDPDRFIIGIDGVSGRPVIKGEECDEREYKFLSESHGWAVENDPDDPAASPRSSIDHMKSTPIF